MGCEFLETRRLLAITVDTLVDEADGSIDDGDVSLRDALALAPVGESIDFDASLNGGKIRLTLGELPITRAVTVDATDLDDGLTVDASTNDPTPVFNDGRGSRVIHINDGDSDTQIDVVILGLTLSGGDVDGEGGAIKTSENLMLSSSTVADNAATNAGGGIWASGILTLRANTIFGNSTSPVHGRTQGGGIWASGDLLVVSSTILENRTFFSGSGGGIWASGELMVVSSTITENSAGDGGGIWNDESLTASIENSIVAGNTGYAAAPDLRPGGVELNLRYSLIGDSTGTGLIEAPVGIPDLDGNLIGGPVHGIIDPLLAPLADNGGPTKTRAPASRSPAMNAGDPGFVSPPDFDQRGEPFLRVRDGPIDMGAFEWQPVTAGVLVVDKQFDEMDADFGAGDLSLREALFLANFNPGADVITFDPLFNNRTILLRRGELVVSDSLSIDATELTDGLIIHASGGGRVFHVDDGDDSMDSPVELRGLTLTGGKVSGPGGGIFSHESLSVYGSTITNNTASTSGGGIGVTSSGSVTISDSVITHNRSEWRGGGVDVTGVDGGKTRISRSNVFDNRASYGAGIAVWYPAGGTSEVMDNTVSNNSTLGNRASGGGIYVLHGAAGAVMISGNTVVHNSTSGNSAEGGGVYVMQSAGGTTTVSGNTVSHNSTSGTGAEGGGIYIMHDGGGTVIVSHNEVSNNSTSGTSAEGGGVHVATAGQALIASNNVTENSSSGNSPVGLGIFASAFDGGNVLITENSVVGNFRRGRAGSFGIATRNRHGGYAAITDNTVTGNTGGILASGDGTTEVVDNRVTDNLSTGLLLSAADGGRILISDNLVLGNTTDRAAGGLNLFATTGGAIVVANTTIAGNSSVDAGGGIRASVRDGGVLHITGVTVSGNHTESNGAGIHIINQNGSVVVEQSTISGNSANGFGGGVMAENKGSTEIAFRHVTITNNIADLDSDGTGSGGGGFAAEGVLTLDHTIIAGNHDNSGSADDVAGVVNSQYSLIGLGGDLLGPLADNGGPTQTHALLPGSPAIDAGGPDYGLPYEFDQRGSPFVRIAGGRVDVGAFEAQTLGDMDFDGDIDMDDIDALVVALRDAAVYEARYGVAPATNGDTDADGDFDFDDIPGFVDLLGPPPTTGGTSSGAAVAQLATDSSEPRATRSRRGGNARRPHDLGIRPTNRRINAPQSEAVWSNGLGWLGPERSRSG